MTDTPTLADFLPLVGRTLEADAEPQPLTLTVVSATAETSLPAPFRAPFTVVLSSPKGHVLTEGFYLLTLPAEAGDGGGAPGRSFDVHLQPIASLGDPLYQAVFA